MRTMTILGRNVVTFCQLLTTYTGICSLVTKNNGYLVSHKLVMMIICEGMSVGTFFMEMFILSKIKMMVTSTFNNDGKENIFLLLS